MTKTLADMTKNIDRMTVAPMLKYLTSDDFDDVVFGMGHYTREFCEALAGEVSFRIIEGLINAEAATFDGYDATVSQDGPKRTISITKQGNDAGVRIELEREDDNTSMWVYSNDDYVFRGFVFDGEFSAAKGSIDSDELQNFFDICQVIRPFAEHWGISGLECRYNLYRGISAAVTADGGLAGANCKALLQHVLRERAKVFLPAFAKRIAENAHDLAELGYIWGQRYLEYGDLDRYAVSIPRGGNHRSVACFHENIDLNSDDSSFMVVVDLDDEGAPCSIRCHAFTRWKTDRPPVINAFMNDGTEPTPMLWADLRTGELSDDMLIGSNNNLEYLPFMNLQDRDIINLLKAGEGDLPDDRDCTDFSHFELEPADEDDEL